MHMMRFLYESSTSISRSIPRQVDCSLLAIADRVPLFGGSSSTQGNRGAQWFAQDDGVPTPVHAGEMRNGRQGGRESFALLCPAVEASAVSAGIGGRGNGLPVLAGCFGKPPKSGGGRGD